ncbi:MAG: RNA polymerase sigma factor [Eubacterium ventriosum]
MAKPEVSSAKENRKSKPEVSFAFKLNKLNCHARSYYFVITIRSVCIDYLRKNKIKLKYLDEYVTEEQVSNTNMSEKGHINEFEKSEMYIDLSNALLKMSERDKELLTYRYTMEMSSKEISKITGIKESNVNSYIRRAREKLLKIFNGEV